MLVAVAAALGVLVDLDHFLLARLNTGRWRATVAVLRNPRLVLFDQASIFESGEVGALQRLGSHAVITVVLVPAVSAVSGPLAVTAAVVLVGHIVSDVIWDYTPIFGPARAHAR